MCREAAWAEQAVKVTFAVRFSTQDVRAVSEVLRIPESTVEPAPAVVAGIGSEYIEGVGRLDDRLLILLDLEALLGNTGKEAH